MTRSDPVPPTALSPSPALAMRGRALVLFGLAFIAASCGREPALPTLESLGMSETDAEPVLCAVPDRTLRVDTLAAGLAVPWDVTFLSDGRALFTERPGRIRVFTADGELDPEPWATLDIHAREEVGLMGIDARRNEAGELEVYVAATHRPAPSGQVSRVVGGAWRRLLRLIDPERGHPITLRVMRIPEVEGRAGEPDVIVENLPAFMLHGGGALRFGPDGLLYVTNGDAAEPRTAHDPRSMRGKILRFEPDGRPAGALPDAPGSPVFALGIRHVQGMAWDADTGRMLVIDHGPSGMIQEDYRGNRDELSSVAGGDHLGWPIATGTTSGGPFVSALTSWTPAIAPAGFDLYRFAGSPWDGSALVSGLRGETLRRLELEQDAAGSLSVRCEDVVLERDYGRLRMVRVAPDGTVWMSTSNTDGRGVPRDGDDLLLRLHPPAPSVSTTSYR